jgi:hypothetical protein
MYVSRIIGIFVMLATAACTSDDGPVPPQVGTNACSIDGQKQFVLDQMQRLFVERRAAGDD